MKWEKHYMEITKIKELIKKKIAEHTTELKGCDFTKENIQKSLAKGKMDLQNNKQDAILQARTLMGLSVKATFHKAAIDTLNDLLTEIEKENN